MTKERVALRCRAGGFSTQVQDYVWEVVSSGEFSIDQIGRCVFKEPCTSAVKNDLKRLVGAMHERAFSMFFVEEKEH
jgi:hypothetical protein